MIQIERDCAYNPSLVKIWQDLPEKQRLRAFATGCGSNGCDFVHN
jgi:hypothetical protein